MKKNAHSHWLLCVLIDCANMPVCVLQDWQRKLSQLLPEKQRLTEKLRNITLSQHSCG